MTHTTQLPKNINAITEHLQGLDNNEIINAHNTYCQENHLSDDEIFNNDDEFFNMFFENKVIEAVRAATYGDYNYSHDWVKFNGYANLESTSDPFRFVDINSIAEHILENPEAYDIELEEEETEEEN